MASNILTSLSVLAVLIALCRAAATSQDSVSPPQQATTSDDVGGINDTAVGVAGSNREDRLFPVVQIVTFDNSPCVAANGQYGTCYSRAECTKIGGISSGGCANNYGVCCVISQSCGTVITHNNTYWSNPGYPSSYATPGMCMSEIRPPVGTCQILLTFVAFDLVGPVAGDCNNDTFIFVGGNTGTFIPVLCGYNGGQHYYVDVDNASPPYKLITTLSAIGYPRHWNIKTTFIARDDPYKAPFKCLQYFRHTSGMISSFNYGGQNPQLLNNLNYAICFACVPGFCDVGLSFNLFDIGNIGGICTYDYVASGPQKFCGDFPSLTIQVNATGPLVVWVGTDSNNDNLESGFAGTYMMMAC